MTLSITLIGGPTALIEIDGFRLLTDPTFDPPGALHTDGWAHFKQSGGDLKSSFDTLGFGSRLKMLVPGVATRIEQPDPG
jgi:L-ascorbate metabolism protein UlaG (beta-lactamase superfamily)